jgi:hypothetical protein
MKPELFQKWGRRDPVGQFEEYLAHLGRPLALAGDEGSTAADAVEWNRSLMRTVEAEVLQEVDAAEQEALQSREVSVPQPGRDEDLECYG